MSTNAKVIKALRAKLAAHPMSTLRELESHSHAPEHDGCPDAALVREAINVEIAARVAAELDATL